MEGQHLGVGGAQLFDALHIGRWREEQLLFAPQRPEHAAGRDRAHVALVDPTRARVDHLRNQTHGVLVPPRTDPDHTNGTFHTNGADMRQTALEESWPSWRCRDHSAACPSSNSTRPSPATE
eukprot:CAMPEP_0181220020 /NCGR_PEP_ID=MMETSP1096-20121128/28607_1 /TAXON_ID=156174 ORGANISM="Chrysochromulina ericina, Strain CCMP281" /NCGR_SAMPLE_ID=MMETSP1096 /ASSEMBLY_ACC=CAM_ASM_000453 /LENGTH=121 /DNA_ID=CAMNT_0023312481 /DNA_START=618 /DNA_END=983 /DNA_ORIENTATION=-